MKNSRRSFLRCSMASPLFIASLGQRGTSAATTSLSEANSGSSVLAEPARQIPVAGESDVIVCGAGPAGVAAAIAAARCGATVRLLEVHGCLGGIWTAGLLSWILDAGNKKGIIQEIIARLRMRDAVATYPEGASNAVGYRPEIMKWVLEEMIQEAGVCVQLFTRVCAAHVDDTKRLQAVITESKSGRQGWRA
ncbi:MAG TPA: FAD-dependent oxidoreductase, partial [Thermogutta sp.]|nr:FAD-dependent oxidoreductase [Thermogutta sp.]